jgi:hypothetical protein
LGHCCFPEWQATKRRRSAENGGATHGDQIGRIFASWAIVWAVFLITEVAKYLCYFLPTVIDSCALILAKHVLGNILGDFFFTNASGHTCATGRTRNNRKWRQR